MWTGYRKSWGRAGCQDLHSRDTGVEGIQRWTGYRESWDRAGCQDLHSRDTEVSWIQGVMGQGRLPR